MAVDHYRIVVQKPYDQRRFVAGKFDQFAEAAATVLKRRAKWPRGTEWYIAAMHPPRRGEGWGSASVVRETIGGAMMLSDSVKNEWDEVAAMRER